jgi:hypothetical protein
VNRVSQLGGPEFYNLQCASAMLVQAFGPHVFLVGSALERRDFRDVDVRCILPDEAFDRLFPGREADSKDPLWCLLCGAISEWLATRTKLPVDFQIQRATAAHAEEKGRRHYLGIFSADPVTL